MNILGSSFLLNIFGITVAICLLSILVAVHEAGHLLMAKWCNIRVDIFSIGMGKPIWGRKYGETYYQIGRLPFGGFCGFGDEENPNDTDPRALINSPLWARLLTVLAGSLFNILFAYFVITSMYIVGFNEIQLSNKVLVPEKILSTTADSEIISPAYSAGLRNGDQIISINGKEITHFMQIPNLLFLSESPEEKITFIRNKETNTVDIIPLFNKETGQDLIGIKPVRPAIISDVLQDSPADKAGLKSDDCIEIVDGKAIEFFYQLEDLMNRGKELSLQIKRGNTHKIVRIQPMKKDGIWNIGVLAEYPHEILVYYHAKNFIEALIMAHRNISYTITQIGLSIKKLFSGKIDIQKNISGPIRIVSIAGNIAKTFDFVLVSKFLVMLSLALAIFNLLPFPGLDGGAIILQTARSLFKDNDRAEKFIALVEQFGIVLLLMFAVLVLFNDIRNIFLDNKKDLDNKSKIYK